MDQTFIEAPKPGTAPFPDGPQAVDSQLPRFDPAPSHAEMEAYKGPLQTEERRKTLEEPSDRVIELPQVFTSPSRPQQRSLQEDQFPVQTQQARLFNDPRRHRLFGEYNEVIRQNPDSHLARLGELAHYVFDNGRPARVWTAGGVGSAQVGLDPSKTSIHGRCNCTYDEADILLLTESEHAAWSRANNPPKLVVIRDPKFSQRRPAKTTESWLREQEKRTHKKWVDVQRLNRQCNDGAAENIPLADAIQQWRTSQNSDAISLDTPPMNLLNISDKTVGHWPEGLAKDYQLLFEAIDECEAMIYRSLDERLLPLSEQDRGVGKTTLMLFSHSDIQKCTQFRILAHRGACSSWHIDNAGVYTFIVLEGNIDSPDEKDEDVVKYWPVYPTHHMNAQDEAVARLAFSKEGINWRPTPDSKIPVIALTRGDMLIQPPGTIHAPITLTNCFFLGGMAWRRSTLPQTLNVWHYLMKNDICTNEPLPRQSQAILDFIRTAVHDAPEAHGYQEGELGEFDKICDEISGMVSKCGCSKACSLSTKCSCLMQGLKCGIRCHRGSALHHSTCTTVNMLSPSSVSSGKKHTKRSRLRDDEDTDYLSNGTPVAKAKKKKRVVEASQGKAPSSTLDSTVMQPHAHLHDSPVAAGSDYMPDGTLSENIKRESAVGSPEAKALEALVPNASANNSPAVVDSTEQKRPEICPKSSTGAICAYEGIRGDGLRCKDCRRIVQISGETTQPRRQRADMKPGALKENVGASSPIIDKGVTNPRACHECKRSTIAVGRKGPNGPNTLCGACAKTWAKLRANQGTNIESAKAATLPSIENEVLYATKCDICNKTGMNPARMEGGMNGPRTICGTCANKRRKAKRENEANNKGDVQPAMGALDEAKSTGNITPVKKRETSARPSQSKTPEASIEKRRWTEDYCLRCKKTKSAPRWDGYEGSAGKGKQCHSCYRKHLNAIKRERLVGSKTASPSPAKDNDPNSRSGIKLRFSPAAFATTKENNEVKMDQSPPQQGPPLQLQSGIPPPSFDSPPVPTKEDGTVYTHKTDFSIAPELPAAAEHQKPVQQDPVTTYPFQHSDPRILIDLQSFGSHKEAPAQPVEHKPEAGDHMAPESEPQTLPTLAQGSADASFSKSPNLNTKPETIADLPNLPDLPPTNGSTTTESPGENTNSYSSPLSEIDDAVSDPENANLSNLS
ncbi:hypothetical protein V494_01727 [Pseudogymnoascus sp. VKM F-4513 (FW-928)]|nr:hypothetical protein V494_01727 [Pseudogymnoascus sp. VKM F-4513 (FW-928)]